MKSYKSKYCLSAVKFMLALGLISSSAIAASQVNQTVVTYPVIHFPTLINKTVIADVPVIVQSMIRTHLYSAFL